MKKKKKKKIQPKNKNVILNEQNEGNIKPKIYQKIKEIVPDIPNSVKKHKNITPAFEQKCIRVRIQRNGKQKVKNFHLRDFLTWEKAFKKAKKWLEKTKKKLPKRKNETRTLSKRNKSGIPGVFLINAKTKNKKTGKKYEFLYWGARWIKNDKNYYTRWSIKEFGKKKAFYLACASRFWQKDDKNYILENYKLFKKSKHFKRAKKCFKKNNK